MMKKNEQHLLQPDEEVVSKLPPQYLECYFKAFDRNELKDEGLKNGNNCFEYQDSMERISQSTIKEK